MKLEKIATCLLMFLLFLAACRQSPGPPAPAPEAAPAKEKEATLSVKQPWEIKWDEVAKDAKKEGNVVVYSGMSGDIFRGEVIKKMKERYGITVDMTVGKSTELIAKMFSERRAGLFLIDIFIAGATSGYNSLKPEGTIVPIKPFLILPELTDPELIRKTWWGGELPWKGKGYDILGLTLWVVPTMIINTELVRPEEIKSYQDLLHPKWKGKIIMYDPTIDGSGVTSVNVLANNVLGWDYFVKLARQEPLILRDRRQMVEWLARGKYAILWGSPVGDTVEFMQAGAPIKWVKPVEGTYLTSASANLMLLDRYPHPSAAKVFINWLLTKEAQDILARAWRTPTPRLDATKEGVDPIMLPEPGKKYLLSDDEETLKKMPEVKKRAAEIFSHLIK